MAVVCIDVVLDAMNTARLDILHKAFRVTAVTEPQGLNSADDVFGWIFANVNRDDRDRADRLVIVISYDRFGETELVKLLDGLEKRGWGEDAVVCGFEDVQRGETAAEGLSEYFMEGGPFELKPSGKTLSVWPITGAYAARN
ncbi:MAG: hypothetical protein A3I33_00790 [Candidatus Colwellbacteria bacterium RIFCSPLOWO2_02_FULL_45_11]|uniref:Uncharacterized protein n=1 Tax=Candidatus Colwellbacteria bacterium RIFCSPLOWO2_02_FULL_45_11 TaxID=1797692 RepID=A0A1G1ZAC9_9BACT|nr:MAG: hypothetical protein A3I33_00790 [Candidatus Colwellbacteria bacterium RIFCSPLOWO2_02_FULL_45_11]